MNIVERRRGSSSGGISDARGREPPAMSPSSAARYPSSTLIKRTTSSICGEAIPARCVEIWEYSDRNARGPRMLTGPKLSVPGDGRMPAACVKRQMDLVARPVLGEVDAGHLLLGDEFHHGIRRVSAR